MVLLYLTSFFNTGTAVINRVINRTVQPAPCGNQASGSNVKSITSNGSWDAIYNSDTYKAMTQQGSYTVGSTIITMAEGCNCAGWGRSVTIPDPNFPNDPNKATVFNFILGQTYWTNTLSKSGSLNGFAMNCATAGVAKSWYVP